MAKAIMRDGRYDIRVMVIGGERDYVYDGVQVYSVSVCKIGSSDYFSCVTDWLKKWLFLRKLKTIGIDLEKIVVCHINIVERLCHYGVWIKKKNLKCFVFAHHHWSGLFSLPGGKMNYFSALRAYEYWRLCRDFWAIDAHVFCSEHTRRCFGKLYPTRDFSNEIDLKICLPRLLRDKYFMKYRESVVFYNGINTRLFSSSTNIKPLHGKFRIGCVANFTPSKSQITLIKAFALFVSHALDAELIFVGSGMALDRCKKWVATHELTGFVTFIHEMDHKELPEFYQSLSLFVLPSYFEAFNCTIIEAWACGVPCFTTDVISFKEVLSSEDRKTWLFPAKDEKTLADKLLWAYRTRPMRQRLVTDLNIDKITHQFLDWVELHA